MNWPVYGLCLWIFSTASADIYVSCPAGFDIDCNERCYKVVRTRKVTWEDAKKECAKLGGARLASVRSQEEMICVTNFQANSGQPDGRQWIGLFLDKDPAIDPNNWRWVDPDAPWGKGSYQHWAVVRGAREPNGDGSERCAEMITDKNYYIEESGPRVAVWGVWNNLPCDTLQHYICEQPKPKKSKLTLASSAAEQKSGATSATSCSFIGQLILIFTAVCAFSIC